MSRIKPVVHSYPYTLSAYGLFDTVSVDLIENLRVDEYGMTMIVVIIDNFSRFVDLYPISNTSAEAAADALIQFTGRFKTPLRFTTDSGSNFKSTLMKGLTDRLGSDHELTNAYSKEQNGMVERVNREVLTHLRAIIFDKRVQQKWSKYIPIVQRYINTSVHSATGCTPAEIVFPRGVEIDRALLTDVSVPVLSSYIRDMQEAQAQVIAVAELHLRRRDAEHVAARQGVEPEFKKGDYVLVEHRHNSLRLGPKSKMLPYLAGPMLVERKLHKGMYTLRDLITMTQKPFHVSTMRHFRYDERTLPPIRVAATDSFDEFVIESVLDMRGDPRGKKADIAFLIRWAGYGPEDDTWVSWADGRKSTAIQLYLFNHPSHRVRKLGSKGFDPNNLEGDSNFERNSDNEDEDTPT
jgi:transposase InsO family protein